jgi:MFS family permease
MRLPGILEPLRHRDFRLLWTGQTISTFGNFIHGVALPFQILALGGGAVELGVWGAAYSLSTLVFILVGGAIADRLPRRTVILTSDLASGVAVAILAVLSASGALRREHIYAAAVVLGATSSFLYPAVTAIIPELVPAEVLQAGNAVRGASRQIALLGGPVAGGALVAFAGLPSAFAFDAATFFVSFAALFAAGPPRHEPAAPVPLLRQVRDGLAYTFSVPWLWIFIFGWSFVLLGMVGPFQIAMPLLVRDVMHGDAAMFGIIGAALGVGEVVTGLALAQIRIRRLGLAILAFGLLGGISVMAIGLVPILPAVLVCAAAFGVQLVGVGVLWTTAVQKHVPRDVMGRVMSIDLFGGSLLLPLAPLIFAAIVASLGPASAFTIGGSAVVAFLLICFLIPSLRELE